MEDVVIQALARAMQFTNEVPATRSLHYRRIGVRQQQLYARAAQLNPDYAGVCAIGVLAGNALDFADLAPAIDAAESVTRVDIEDAGTSEYAAGDEVTIVPSTATESGLAPRATVRNRVLRSVGADLDGVVSLKVHYCRLPAAVVATDKDRLIDVPEPHSELLIVDLALSMLRKVASTQTGAAEVQGGIELLGGEEEKLLAGWDAHVLSYVGGLVSQFGTPPSTMPKAG